MKHASFVWFPAAWAAFCLMLVALPVCATTPPGELLTFAAIGDGPRHPVEEPVLLEQLAKESAKGTTEFVVHVGDIIHGIEVLPESHYEKVAGILKTSTVPVIIVPGDNEWNDLDDPDVGWTYWTKHFLGFEKGFKNAPKTRRQEVRPENVAWISKGVLMIGLNLVGGRIHDKEEWQLRHKQNAEWVRENLEARGRDVRAAVVFCQAKPNKKHADFVAPFAEAATRFGKPVLFLHGDGHHYQVEEAWAAPNVTRLMIDQVAIAPPTIVQVTTDPKKPFIFDRQLDGK
jgi:Calcineurin-like phosphoesterase